MQKQSILQNLDLITDHFSTVTSNLMNQYYHASETVASSFEERDSMKIHDAIQSLIDGQNKSNHGTMQKFFDQRDMEITKIHTQEVRLDQSETEWVDVCKE